MKPVKSFMLAAVVCLLAVVALRFSSDSGGKAFAANPSSAAPANEAKVVEDSMHEFMEYVFQPTYRRLKDSMAEEPVDNKGWKAIKSDSLILAESCNLLFVRLPAENAADWSKHAVASRTSGAELYQAARDKDFSKAGVAYKTMLNNCNACHRQFEEGKHILEP